MPEPPDTEDAECVCLNPYWTEDARCKLPYSISFVIDFPIVSVNTVTQFEISGARAENDWG